MTRRNALSPPLAASRLAGGGDAGAAPASKRGTTPAKCAGARRPFFFPAKDKILPDSSLFGKRPVFPRIAGNRKPGSPAAVPPCRASFSPSGYLGGTDATCSALFLGLRARLVPPNSGFQGTACRVCAARKNARGKMAGQGAVKVVPSNFGKGHGLSRHGRPNDLTGKARHDRAEQARGRSVPPSPPGVRAALPPEDGIGGGPHLFLAGKKNGRRAPAHFADTVPRLDTGAAPVTAPGQTGRGQGRGKRVAARRP